MGKSNKIFPENLDPRFFNLISKLRSKTPLVEISPISIAEKYLKKIKKVAVKTFREIFYFSSLYVKKLNFASWPRNYCTLDERT